MPIKVIIIKVDNSFQSMALFKIKIPGIDNVTVAVIKASEVPNATPLPVKASTTGITLTELA